jgi:hypothetical protein
MILWVIFTVIGTEDWFMKNFDNSTDTNPLAIAFKEFEGWMK